MWKYIHSDCSSNQHITSYVKLFSSSQLHTCSCAYFFSPLFQVFVAAITKRKQVCPSSFKMLHGSQSTVILHHNVSTESHGGSSLLHTDKFRSCLQNLRINMCIEITRSLSLKGTHEFYLSFASPIPYRFLDKACIKIQDDTGSNESPWRLCTMSQVEQVKILISVVPIFACTIIFNTILAQLQTFSVQQGSIMNTKLTSNFEIPPASLQSIPYVMLVFLVPLYETAFVRIARKITGHDSGISPLQRVGVGLFIATFSMVSAAVVENKRRTMALRDPRETLSIFWIAPQFLVFGVSEMFTAVGLIEFFYKQSLEGMQSFLTAMTYCSYSFGFYISSILVSLVNKVTSRSGHGGWLSDNNLNNDRLDLFYWLLAGLSFVNFFNYLFWSRWYCYNPSLAGHHEGPGCPKDSTSNRNDIETG